MNTKTNIGKKVFPKKVSLARALAGLMPRPLALLAGACAAALLAVAPPVAANEFSYERQSDAELTFPRGITVLVEGEELYTISEGAGTKRISVGVDFEAQPQHKLRVTVRFFFRDAAGDTATENVDYLHMPNRTKHLSWLEGWYNAVESKKRYYTQYEERDLTIIDDNLHEGNEYLTVRVTNDCSGAEGPGCVSWSGERRITIIDNDPAPSGITLIAASDSISETAAARAVTVTAAIDGASRFVHDHVVRVAVGASNVERVKGLYFGGGICWWTPCGDGIGDGDTAVEGVDYATLDDFFITIPGGSASATGSFMLTPIDDILYESGETLSVSGMLSSIFPSYHSMTVTGDTITLTSDEAVPPVTLTADTDSLAEYAAATAVTVTAAVDPTGTTRFDDERTVTVAVGNSGDTAIEGTDYDTVDDLAIVIPRGASSATGIFTLTPRNETLYEAAETLSLAGTVSGFGAVPVTGAEIEIVNDDAPGLTLNVDTTSISEDPEEAATVTVTVTANEALSDDVELALRTGLDSDTAIKGTDYSHVDDLNVFFPSGTPSGATRTVTKVLTPTHDLLHEGDEKLTVFAYRSDVPAMHVAARTEITITDDDPAPEVTVTIDTDSEKEGIQSSIPEGAGSTLVTATVTLDVSRFPDGRRVLVEFGKSGDAATKGRGKDYRIYPSSPALISIPAGEASASANFISFTPRNDSVAEGDETLTVVLTDPDGKNTIEGRTTTLTIIDDDEAGFTPSATELTVQEAGTGSFTLKLSSEPVSSVVVTLASDDAAIATLHSGSAASAQSMTLTFTASNWNTAQTVTVTGQEAGSATVAISASGGGYDSIASSLAVQVAALSGES